MVLCGIIGMILVFLSACEDRIVSLGTMEGHGAFLTDDTLMVFGADRSRRDIDGKEFACADGAPYCRRAFLASYDGSFKRKTIFQREIRCIDLRVTARPRSAGGFYLIAVDETWMNSGSEIQPFFHVTVSTVSSAFEELRTVTIRSDAHQAIHAALVTGGGELYLAGFDADETLFVDRYDAETGDLAVQWHYPAEQAGRIVFFAQEAGRLHLVRHLPDRGYHYLTIGESGAVMNALTIEDTTTFETDPSVGERSIAALLRQDGLYWFGGDNRLYRLVPSTGTFSIETLATLNIGDLSYQRDFRFLDSDLYVMGTNDRTTRGQGCGYGEISTHETELVIEKFDASFTRLWEDRDTEGADYRAIEVIAKKQERFFLFQKNDRVIARPVE